MVFKMVVLAMLLQQILFQMVLNLEDQIRVLMQMVEHLFTWPLQNNQPYHHLPQ